MLDLMKKDVGIGVDLGKALDVPVPIAGRRLPTLRRRQRPGTREGRLLGGVQGDGAPDGDTALDLDVSCVTPGGSGDAVASRQLCNA